MESRTPEGQAPAGRPGGGEGQGPGEGGGFRPREEGGFRPREGGFGSREGGFGSRRGRDGGGGGGDAPNITIRRPFFRRRKTSPFAGKDAPKIDYKDLKLLQRFVSERGKIVPRRITAVTAKEQRDLAQAIKRARQLALLPFVVR
jgi:small subunit ribosomal protein S18